MSLGAPSESNSHLHPTKPSSGSARNSQSLPPQISPPPDPAPLPAASSPAQSFPSHPCLRSRSPSFLRPHQPNPPSLPRSRCLPPTQSAPPHSPQSSCHRSTFHLVSSRAQRGICFSPPSRRSPRPRSSPLLH